MRGSNRTASTKPLSQGGPPQHPNQSLQAHNPANASSAHHYFNVQCGNPSQMHYNQSVLNTSGISGSNQFVHQVIYNQGSVVINNPSNTPTITVPLPQQQSNMAHQQALSQQTFTHTQQQPLHTQHSSKVGNQSSSSHQKTKSTHHTFQNNSIFNPEIGSKVKDSSSATGSSQHPDLQAWQITQQSNTNLQMQQSSAQVQTPGGPGHKKSQSMVQSKIAHLLTQGAKKIQNQANPSTASNVVHHERTDTAPAELGELLNRSMDHMTQVGKRHPQQSQGQQHQNADELELMRVLLDQKNLKELSYQHQNEYTVSSKEAGGSFQQFMGKHVRAATHGTHSLLTQPNEVLTSATYQLKSSGAKLVRPPSSKVQKSDLLGNSNLSVHTKQSATNGKGSITYPDKIASTGKVFASGSVVKKPTKLVSQAQAHQHAVMTQQIPVQVSSGQHHRIKSDQQNSQKGKEIAGISQATFLQQKDSSAHHQLQAPSSTIQYDQHPTSAAHNSFAVSSSQNAAHPQKNVIHRTFQQPPTQVVQAHAPITTNQQQLVAQLIQAQGQTQQAKSKVVQQPHRKKPSSKEKVAKASVQQISGQGQPVQYISKEKQAELQELYNKLLKKHAKLSDNVLLESGVSLKQCSAGQTQTKKYKQSTTKEQQALYALACGASEDRSTARDNNQRWIQSTSAKNNVRGSSWDGKISASNSALTLQQFEHQQNQMMKVPPQSSSSSLKTNQVFSYQQQPNVQVSNPRTGKAKTHSTQVGVTSDTQLQTKYQNQQAAGLQSKESNERFTPISSAKGSLKNDEKLQTTSQSKSKTMRESATKNSKPHQKLWQQSSTDELPENQVNGAGLKNQRRSLSNGSNESARFKFNKSVNGVPVFTVSQPQTVQPSIVSRTAHISRQSLSSRDTSQGKQKIQTAYQQSPTLKQGQQVQAQPQTNLSPQDIKQQQSYTRQGVKMRPKSKSNQQQKEAPQKQQTQQSQINSKFKISTSSNQSPRFQYQEQKRSPDQQQQKAFQHPNLSLKMRNRGENRETQPMVILENTPPEPITPAQLSDWDRMISQQFKRGNNAMINNLVGAAISATGQPIESIKYPKESDSYLGGAKPGHMKNKLSAQSDTVSQQSKLVQSSQQQLKVVTQPDNQTKIEMQKPRHKRVKSDIPVNQKNLICMNNFVNNSVQQDNPTEVPPNSHPISSNQRTNFGKQLKQAVVPAQKEHNFIRNRLEANPSDNRKQFNISVEQLDFDEDDKTTQQQQVEQPTGAQQTNHTKQKEKRFVNKDQRTVSVPPRQQHADSQSLEKPQKKVQKIVTAPHQRLKSEIAQKNQVPLMLNVRESEIHQPQEILKPQKQQKKSVGQLQLDHQQQLPLQPEPTPQLIPQKEIFAAPQNSINQSLGVSPDRGPAPHVLQSDWMIETQESMDSNISPREKIHRKLVHHIKKSFEQTGECPATTVEFYRVGKVLGKGAFGKVNIAMQVIAKQLVAIKSINTTHFKDDIQSKKVMQEVIILKQTRHRNIVRLYEFFQTQKHVLIVIELSSGGDLLSYVRKRRQLKEEVAKSVFKQIIEAIKYCHSKRILHRDIKLDNILLTVEGGVKICDFGVSKQVKPGERMTEQCGTPAYIAPEILVDKGYEGFAIDVWSAGVVLYAMLYGTVPFKANNMTELQKMIIKANYTLSEGISKDARDLLKSLLEKDPQLRITVPGILAHPWMRDAKDTVELFTNAEKNYMLGQLMSSQDQQNQPNPNGNDFFSDQMLETNQNSMKNAETKSIILAPFNSTRSNLKEIERHYSLPDEIKEMIQSKSCLKFAHRVREIDKQYEVNNNAELDNGVYHDFNQVEKEDSLQSDFRSSIHLEKVEKAPQDQLHKLEKMILQQEAGAKEVQEYHEQEHSKQEQPYRVEELQIEPIDEELVQEAAQLGYSAAALTRYLQKNELNNATTTYYLLQSKKQPSSTVDTTTQKKKA